MECYGGSYVLKCAYRGNLYVGYGDVEEVIHVCIPDNSYIGDDHRPKVSLVTEEEEIGLLLTQLRFLIYLERFQTPFTVETISSIGRSLRFFVSRIAPLSLSSLYILLELKALQMQSVRISD